MGTTGHTTIRLDDGLLAQAKREARRRGQTFTSLVAEGLRLVIARGGAPTTRRRRPLPVSRATGGVLPGVDISNTADLLDRLDGLK